MPGKATRDALTTLKKAGKMGGKEGIDILKDDDDDDSSTPTGQPPPNPQPEPKLSPNTPTVKNAPPLGAQGIRGGGMSMPSAPGAGSRGARGGGGGGGPKMRIGPKSIEHDPMSVVPDLDIRMMNKGGLVKHGSSTHVSCKGK